MLLFVSRYAERETSPLPPSLPSSLVPPYIPTSVYRREGICAQSTNERSSIVPWRSWRKSVQVHSPLRETANTDAAAARKKERRSAARATRRRGEEVGEMYIYIYTCLSAPQGTKAT